MFVSAGDRAGRGIKLGFKINDWFEGQSTISPNGVIGVSSWNVKGSITNLHAAIVPQGLGGILVATPDTTNTGGNARNGKQVLDFQFARTAATQIAEEDGTALFNTKQCTVTDSTHNAGIRNTGIYSAFNSTIQGSNWVGPGAIIAATNATINGPKNGSLIAGGSSQTLTEGLGSNGIILGTQNTLDASLNNSSGTVIIGANACKGGLSSFALIHGKNGQDRGCNSMYVHGIDGNGTAGTNQGTRYVLRSQTNTSTSTMCADATNTAASLNQIGPFPTGLGMILEGRIFSKGTTTEYGSWSVGPFTVRNVAGTITITGVSTPTLFDNSINMATATLAIVADNTNKSINVNITTPAAAGTQIATAVFTATEVKQ